MERYKKGQLGPEELEETTSGLVQAKFDDDYKNRWKEKLENQYGIQRGGTQRKKGRRLFLWKAIAAAVLLALLAIPGYFYQRGDSQKQIAKLVASDIFVNKEGGKKGMTLEVEKVSQEAALYFNRQDFQKAKKYYLQLIEQNQAQQSDYFYLAYSSLKLEETEESIQYFYRARELQKDPDHLREEINWYLSLALSKNGKKEEARKEMENIQQGEWKYEEVQGLLGSL